MGKVVADMSMSVDGFIAGPNPAPDNPLGDHGLKLHDWFFKNREAHKDLETEMKEATGAMIMGRRMFDESLPWWNGSGPMGDDIPCFVLTDKGTEPKEAARLFTFVTDGIESALALAQKAAGDKNIGVAGAHTIQQYIKTGHVDELLIHIVPILLGGGTSLFGSLGTFMELEKLDVTDELEATHMTYRFLKTNS